VLSTVEVRPPVVVCARWGGALLGVEATRF